MPQKFEKSLQKTKSNFLSERLMRLKKMRQITMLSRKFQFDKQVLLVTSKKLGDFFQVNIHVGLNKGV